MARADKKAGKPAAGKPKGGASRPDAAPTAARKGRRPAAPGGRKRAAPEEPVVVAQEACEVVVTGPPGPSLEEVLRQRAEVWLLLKSLRNDQEAVGRELSQHREESVAAFQQFLRETRDGTERVRRECEATTAQLGEIDRQFREVGRLLLAEFENQLSLVSRELQAARDQLQSIPRQADEYRQRVEEMGRSLPEAEEQIQGISRTSEAARLDLDRVERDTRDARKRLEAVRYETAREEARLAAVRGEFREVEGRLQELRRQLDQVSDDAAAARNRAGRGSVPGDETTGATAGEPSEVRNRFGVAVDPGVVVADVQPGSPAGAAGLARGDVVTAVNGTPVFTGTELRDRVHGAADETDFVLQVRRGGAVRDVTVRLNPTPRGDGSEGGRDRMGVTVQPGVVVAAVTPGSPAEAVGLAPGDVVAEVNGTPVLTGEQLREAVLGAHGREFTLRVVRGGEAREVAAWLADVPVNG